MNADWDLEDKRDYDDNPLIEEIRERCGRSSGHTANEEELPISTEEDEAALESAWDKV